MTDSIVTDSIVYQEDKLGIESPDSRGSRGSFLARRLAGELSPA